MLPPSFDELLLEDLTSDVFVCLTSPDARAEGPTTRAVLQEFHTPRHNSYLYVVGSVPMQTMTRQHVLAYETSMHPEGVNVLFGDGHVECLLKRQAEHLIAELQAGHNPPRP
jgi:prepilin-type processing-associated H-X9-DG protein